MLALQQRGASRSAGSLLSREYASPGGPQKASWRVSLLLALEGLRVGPTAARPHQPLAAGGEEEREQRAAEQPRDADRALLAELALVRLARLRDDETCGAATAAAAAAAPGGDGV